MDNLQQSREYKAAKSLEDAINDFDWSPERFAKSCTTMHRTIQQSLLRTIVAVLREYADPKRSVGSRNEALERRLSKTHGGDGRTEYPLHIDA